MIVNNSWSCEFRSSRGRCHSPHSGDSSEPSEQSMSWSHTKCLGMHWRFWHVNSVSVSQVLLVYTAGGESGKLGSHNLALGVSVTFRSLIVARPTYCSRL